MLPHPREHFDIVVAPCPTVSVHRDVRGCRLWTTWTSGSAARRLRRVFLKCYCVFILSGVYRDVRCLVVDSSYLVSVDLPARFGCAFVASYKKEAVLFGFQDEFCCAAWTCAGHPLFAVRLSVLPYRRKHNDVIRPCPTVGIYRYLSSCRSAATWTAAWRTTARWRRCVFRKCYCIFILSGIYRDVSRLVVDSSRIVTLYVPARRFCIFRTTHQKEHIALGRQVKFNNRLSAFCTFLPFTRFAVFPNPCEHLGIIYPCILVCCGNLYMIVRRRCATSAGSASWRATCSATRTAAGRRIIFYEVHDVIALSCIHGYIICLVPNASGNIATGIPIRCSCFFRTTHQNKAVATCRQLKLNRLIRTRTTYPRTAVAFLPNPCEHLDIAFPSKVIGCYIYGIGHCTAATGTSASAAWTSRIFHLFQNEDWISAQVIRFLRCYSIIFLGGRIIRIPTVHVRFSPSTGIANPYPFRAGSRSRNVHRIIVSAHVGIHKEVVSIRDGWTCQMVAKRKVVSVIVILPCHGRIVITWLSEGRIGMHVKHSLHEYKVSVYALFVIKSTELIWVTAWTESRYRVRRRRVDHIIVAPRSNWIYIVGVVVSILSSWKLISPNNHRYSTGKHLKRNVVACRSPRCLLRSVYKMVLVAVSSIARSERPRKFIVPVISCAGIWRKVCKRKAVMGIYHVHRRSIRAENIWTSVNGISDTHMIVNIVTGFIFLCRKSTNIFSNHVSIHTIPVSPSLREFTDSVTARPLAIPRFCNHLYIVGWTKVRNLRKSRRIRIEIPSTFSFPSKNRGKVKAETVHSHLGYPIRKRVYNQLPYGRIVALHIVSATGRLPICARRTFYERIICRIIYTSHGSKFCLSIIITSSLPCAAFSGMVVNHIKINFYSCKMERSYHLPKFTCRSSRRFIVWVPAFRRKKSVCHVAPIISTSPIIRIAVIIAFMNRKKFYRIYSKFFQIRNKENCTFVSSPVLRKHKTPTAKPIKSWYIF